MAAFHGSRWKNGFLALLPAMGRVQVLQRLEATKPATYEQMVANLNHKMAQNDELWAEIARLKYEKQAIADKADFLQRHLTSGLQVQISKSTELISALHQHLQQFEKARARAEQLNQSTQRQLADITFQRDRYQQKLEQLLSQRSRLLRYLLLPLHKREAYLPKFDTAGTDKSNQG
jgi:chromosome segregation ATPase